MSTTKKQRKTPCPEHKKSMLENAEFWCVGCGHWIIVNGKAQRPA